MKVAKLKLALLAMPREFDNYEVVFKLPTSLEPIKYLYADASKHLIMLSSVLNASEPTKE